MLKIRDHGTRIHIAIKGSTYRKEKLFCDHGPSVIESNGSKVWCTVWLPFCFNPLSGNPMDEETRFIDRRSIKGNDLPVEINGKSKKRYIDDYPEI